MAGRSNSGWVRSTGGVEPSMAEAATQGAGLFWLRHADGAGGTGWCVFT